MIGRVMAYWLTVDGLGLILPIGFSVARSNHRAAATTGFRRTSTGRWERSTGTSASGMLRMRRSTSFLTAGSSGNGR